MCTVTVLENHTAAHINIIVFQTQGHAINLSPKLL